MDKLKSFATPKQLEYLKAIEQYGNQHQAAKALNVNQSTISRSIKALHDFAARRGYSPEHGMTKTTANTHLVKGTSTLYDLRKKEGEEGHQILQWVKTDLNKTEFFNQLIDAAAESFFEYNALVPLVAPPQQTMDELLALYTLGDPHIGMLAWRKEVGEDFDVSIAKRDLLAAMDYLVNLTPPAKTAIILNLGDFFHSDDMENRTRRSGHTLDVDGRWAKTAKLGVDIMMHLIERALQKHDNVIVRNNIGNHDDQSSVWLAICLSAAFAGNPRVTIDDSTCHRWYYRHGKTLLGSAHGNHGKALDYPQIMAVESKDWSATEFRHYYLGHVHHERTIEGRGCMVHYMRTLASKDKYSFDNMYVAGQDMQSHVFHDQHGRLTSNMCPISIARLC